MMVRLSTNARQVVLKVSSNSSHHTVFLWILSLQWLGPGDQAAPQILEAHGLEPCKLRQRSEGLVLLREFQPRIVQPICGG